MHWYLIQSKSRQEKIAYENIERQGFECFLPTIHVEKNRHRKAVVDQEPLFPRYFFVRLDEGGQGQSWQPIRSTVGVTGLVTFGGVPARASDKLITELKTFSRAAPVNHIKFIKGEKVSIVQGPFAGLEAIFEARDGQGRVMLLIEIMSKSTRLNLEVDQVKHF